LIARWARWAQREEDCIDCKMGTVGPEGDPKGEQGRVRDRESGKVAGHGLSLEGVGGGAGSQGHAHAVIIDAWGLNGAPHANPTWTPCGLTHPPLCSSGPPRPHLPTSQPPNLLQSIVHTLSIQAHDCQFQYLPLPSPWRISQYTCPVRRRMRECKQKLAPIFDLVD
jgi:hypothetical protein